MSELHKYVEALYIPITKARRQMNTYNVLNGLALVVITVLLCAGATLLFDWATPMPAGARFVLSLVCLGIVVYVFARWMVKPLTRRVTADQAALAIEARYPELKSALISAVQFGRLLANPKKLEEFYESAALAALTVKETAKRVYKMSVSGIVNWLPTVKLWAVAGVLLLAAGLYTMVYPENVRLWLERFFTPFSARDWPQLYQLVVKHPTKQVTILAKGDSLTVDVLSCGRRHPDTVTLYTMVKDEKGKWQGFWESTPMESIGSTRFRKKLENIVTDMKFYAEAGDATTPVFRINVKERPFIERITLNLHYPEYMKRKDDVAYQGSLRVPQGTKITMTVVVSTKLRKAVFKVKPTGQPEREVKVIEESDLKETEIEVTQGKKKIKEKRYCFVCERVADTSFQYWFELTDTEGFNNYEGARPQIFRIRVVEDQPPSLKFLKPGRSVRMTESAVVPMVLRVTDDYGVEEVSICYFKRKQTERAAAAKNVKSTILDPEKLGYKGKQRAELPFEFDIKKLTGAKPGEEVVYYAVGKDGCTTRNKNGRSYNFVITIVTADELLAEYERAIQRLRDRLERCLRQERIISDKLRILAEDLTAGRRKVGEEPLKRILLKTESDQRDLTASFSLSYEDVQNTLEGLTINRLGDEKMKSSLKQISGALNDLAQTTSPQAATKINVARNKKSKKEMVSALDDAALQTTEVAEAIQQILGMLSEYTTLSRIYNQTRQMKREQDEIFKRIQELLKRILGK